MISAETLGVRIPIRNGGGTWRLSKWNNLYSFIVVEPFARKVWAGGKPSDTLYTAFQTVAMSLPGHYEIRKYSQSTGRVQAKVLQNLRVQGGLTDSKRDGTTMRAQCHVPHCVRDTALLCSSQRNSSGCQHQSSCCPPLPRLSATSVLHWWQCLLCCRGQAPGLMLAS